MCIEWFTYTHLEFDIHTYTLNLIHTYPWIRYKRSRRHPFMSSGKTWKDVIFSCAVKDVTWGCHERIIHWYLVDSNFFQHPVHFYCFVRAFKGHVNTIFRCQETMWILLTIPTNKVSSIITPLGCPVTCHRPFKVSPKRQSRARIVKRIVIT